jgi:glycosyltransferase involved in cell wall biosynthesis
MGLVDQYVIGCVGRLCYQKNQSFLLDVFEEFHKAYRESTLLLVGDGEMRSQLEEKTKQLGLENDVRFCGVSDHVEQMMWAMDMLAMPSYFEGLPLSAIEAQVAGLPVVCSEYIPEETRCTDLVTAVALDQKLWVKALLGHGVSYQERDKSADQIRVLGFDIESVAQCVANRFMKDDDDGA